MLESSSYKTAHAMNTNSFLTGYKKVMNSLWCETISSSIDIFRSQVLAILPNKSNQFMLIIELSFVLWIHESQEPKK